MKPRKEKMVNRQQKNLSRTFSKFTSRAVRKMPLRGDTWLFWKLTNRFTTRRRTELSNDSSICRFAFLSSWCFFQIKKLYQADGEVVLWKWVKGCQTIAVLSLHLFLSFVKLNQHQGKHYWRAFTIFWFRVGSCFSSVMFLRWFLLWCFCAGFSFPRQNSNSSEFKFFTKWVANWFV